jgi:hypothetical protein
MTVQQGYIVAAGPGMVSFVVEIWWPRSRAVYHIYPYCTPTWEPRCVVSYIQEPLRPRLCR